MSEFNLKTGTQWIQSYLQLTNYISAAQLYLKDNFFLETDLRPEHIKNRILGHWGTVPGLNLMYASLNYLISTQIENSEAQYHPNVMFIAGSGHGAPGILSNLLIEGSLAKYYPQYPVDKLGISHLIKDFSWPSRFPSHVYPGLPGSIHEGGELGYSLGTAFGAVFDNPNLLAVCEVGDGEAETGALAASWQSNKFINPESDGVVLPILHLNGYKISGPTVFSSFSEDELFDYFSGLGYTPIIVNQYESEDFIGDYLNALNQALRFIYLIKKDWESYKTVTHPLWPMIILKSKKGWTGPTMLCNELIEDNNLSHGIPLKNPKTNSEELSILQHWLQSYQVNQFFTENGLLRPTISEFLPQKHVLGQVPEAFGGEIRHIPKLPELEKFTISINQKTTGSSMQAFSQYLKDVVQANPHSFRIFSPDESESNKLEPIFEATNRQFLWPIRAQDKFLKPQGQMLEILSEQTLQSWMQGYTLTGRQGVLISYEAFLSVITSQIAQYVKYLTQSQSFPWRKPVSSINYVSTSTLWRQDHNGFTHQNPDLINALLAKYSDFISIYFPADINSMLVTLKYSLLETNKVNLIIAGKTDLPQWLDFDLAKQGFEQGMSVWNFASNEMVNPDIILSSVGDYQTQETLGAISLLKNLVPELKYKYVNINELNCFGLGRAGRKSDNEKLVKELFSPEKPVLLNFHGYPEAIKQLLYGTELSMRMTILGYQEKGNTTTPFDMQVKNGTDRYSMAIQALQILNQTKPELSSKSNQALQHLQDKLIEHANYIVEFGDDLPEVKNWKWE